jgi:hypothetical protein
MRGPTERSTQPETVASGGLSSVATGAAPRPRRVASVPILDPAPVNGALVPDSCQHLPSPQHLERCGFRASIGCPAPCTPATCNVNRNEGVTISSERVLVHQRPKIKRLPVGRAASFMLGTIATPKEPGLLHRLASQPEKSLDSSTQGLQHHERFSAQAQQIAALQDVLVGLQRQVRIGILATVQVSEKEMDVYGCAHLNACVPIVPASVLHSRIAG